MSIEDHTILVVDDEEVITRMTCDALQSELRNEILVANNAEDALRILEDHSIGVVLCDYKMPGTDGTIVLKKAYECNADTVSILVTAYATKGNLMTAVNEGHIWKCIEKPWTVTNLCRSAREALEKYDRSRSGPAAPAKPAARKRPTIARVRSTTPSKPQTPRVVLRKSRRHARNVSSLPKTRTSVSKVRIGPSNLLDKRYSRFQLIEEGGMSTVYKAHDKLLGMPVAIKVVRERFSRDKEAMQELFQEARIAMQLSHNHIVRLHNIHENKGVFYLVMEYIEGSSFRNILNIEGTLSFPVVSELSVVLEEALGYAHDHNVSHRDLKPDNIMLTVDGVIKIVDFGVACLAERARAEKDIVGTPYYMSPEIVHGEPFDHRVDIYSLGITFHELLTGKLPPHAGEGAPDMFGYVPQPSASLPELLRSALAKSFARDPDERWDTIPEFCGALRSALTESPEPEEAEPVYEAMPLDRQEDADDSWQPEETEPESE